ncbi:MAG: hypothetical protein S0880_07710 [Actinomycetota bacterium]|nr:hypothetical protein [Actinomycetota bacterium]
MPQYGNNDESLPWSLDQTPRPSPPSSPLISDGGIDFAAPDIGPSLTDDPNRFSLSEPDFHLAPQHVIDVSNSAPVSRSPLDMYDNASAGIDVTMAATALHQAVNNDHGPVEASDPRYMAAHRLVSWFARRR